MKRMQISNVAVPGRQVLRLYGGLGFRPGMAVRQLYKMQSRRRGIVEQVQMLESGVFESVNEGQRNGRTRGQFGYRRTYIDDLMKAFRDGENAVRRQARKRSSFRRGQLF